MKRPYCPHQPWWPSLRPKWIWILIVLDSLVPFVICIIPYQPFPLMCNVIGPDKLTKGVNEKEWKYVRIQCSTFESGEQYGLARIRIFRESPSSLYLSDSLSSNKSVLSSAPLPSSQSVDQVFKLFQYLLLTNF